MTPKFLVAQGDEGGEQLHPRVLLDIRETDPATAGEIQRVFRDSVIPGAHHLRRWRVVRRRRASWRLRMRRRRRRRADPRRRGCVCTEEVRSMLRFRCALVVLFCSEVAVACRGVTGAAVRRPWAARWHGAWAPGRACPLAAAATGRRSRQCCGSAQFPCICCVP